MTKQTMIATAVSIFAATSFVASSASAQVKCSGTNACKGQSACKMGSSACKGQNACKGQGWSETANAGDCTAKGGHFAALEEPALLVEDIRTFFRPLRFGAAND